MALQGVGCIEWRYKVWGVLNGVTRCGCVLNGVTRCGGVLNGVMRCGVY